MKKLVYYVNKEVKVLLKSGYTFTGFVWRYYKDHTEGYAHPIYEYYIGYDGGFMELIKPSHVIKIDLL